LVWTEKSEQVQVVKPMLAYTMGVGRETTAITFQVSNDASAYTMGVGRETTA
jgi:hypothetical protein